MEWIAYQKKTRNKAPSALIRRAILGHNALDLGAGGLRDTKYLVKCGFQVDAVDIQFTSKPRLMGVSYFEQPFHRFKFPSKRYDVVNFQYSLPFGKKGTFGGVWKKLTRSVKNDGVIVGQLFGKDDEWNTPSSQMTFHTKKEVLELLTLFKIVYFKEERKRKMTLAKKNKRWHIFHIIARKRG